MDLFSFLGVCVKESFFDKAFCDFLVNEVKSAKKNKAFVSRKGKALIDEEFRNTYKVKMPKNIQQDVVQKIKTELQPKLEQFFKTEFSNIQPLEILYYDKGHFFAAHKDVIPTKNKRKVSVVIFLNQQSKNEEELDYGGGNLCLYGLRANAPKQRLVIPSQKGLMVAFKSNTLHEVTPVKWGNRCSLVIWFE